MIHLTSQIRNRQIEVVYHLESEDRKLNRTDGDIFRYELSRTALGLGIEDQVAFICVVGERTYWHPDRKGRPERLYVVLDEAEPRTPADLFEKAVEYKDRYLAHMIFMPDQPDALVEAARRHEGLTYYQFQDPFVNRERWPTYVDAYTRAGLTELKVPQAATLHGDLELLMSTEVLDPATNKALSDRPGPGGRPIHKLLFPNDFPTARTRTAVRQGLLPLCRPLWCAVTGLERSQPKPPKEDGPIEVPQGGHPVTGY